MGDLSDVMQPIEAARGLPNAHYVSDEMFLAERDQLLFDTWAGLTVARRVPMAGDVLPLDFLGVPLLVVRGQDRQVRVFLNVCRHRGMVLVSEAKSLGPGAIRCPYHSWCYGQDGALKATPHVGGPGQNVADGIHRNTLGLVPVRAHVWRDVVFVNMSGQAPAFEDYAGGLMARWSDFEGQDLYDDGGVSAFTLDVACNWKLAVENYCESYHLPWVHPGLNSYSRLEDHYNIEAPGSYSGQGTRVYRPSIGSDGQRFPDFAGLGATWDAGAEYVALYPNVLFGVHRDHAFAIVLEPVAKDRTREHVELYYAAPEAVSHRMADLRSANAALWHQVFEEDIFVVEGMQTGRQAPGFDGGRFSPAMDAATHCFHRWVAASMSG
ncbi:MAG: aromatic ring-hydroxylating dioxygenase subunit alpha [Pseudomonadota bacterium]